MIRWRTAMSSARLQHRCSSRFCTDVSQGPVPCEPQGWAGIIDWDLRNLHLPARELVM